MSKGSVICVVGIDTDIGKTMATGLMARYLIEKGVSVITQKISQTGCSGISEDILQHRKIMKLSIQDVDRDGRSCPYIFSEPCSPHLAALLDGEKIDCNVITQATDSLRERYEIVLLEGVGGLLVPLNEDITLLDYIEEQKYPVVLVSSPRLGSINHTLSALELARRRELEVLGIIYNRYNEDNELIGEDSAKVFSTYLRKNGFQDRVRNMYELKEYMDGSKVLDIDFLLKYQ